MPKIIVTSRYIAPSVPKSHLEYYTKYIQDNPLYQMAGIYADEGISGTNTKKREEFNRMIADCMDGRIDMIITKSISRFARNTLDCLKYIAGTTPPTNTAGK